MDYGVKFDIITSGKQASADFTMFARSVTKNTPKVISDLRKTNTTIRTLTGNLTKLSTASNIFKRKTINIETKGSINRVDTLRKRVVALNTQLAIADKYIRTLRPLPAPRGGGGGGGSGSGGGGGRNRLRNPFAFGFTQTGKSMGFNAAFAGMGAMGATAMLTSGITYLTKESAEFEDIMRNAKNILMMTDKDMSSFDDRFQAVSKNMRQIGIDTKYSSTDVANAMKYLAMAGQDLETIDKSMRPIASLSVLSDAKLPEMADQITNIMAGMRIDPNAMESVADVISSVVTRSNTVVSEMAEAFKMASGTMSLAGIEFNEGAAALGVLANMGIKGTLAGTGLRAMLIRLINPTAKGQKVLDKYNISLMEIGKDGVERMRPLVDIFDEFQKKGVSVQELYKLFDKIAGNPAANLMQNTGMWNKLIDASRVSGGSAEFLAREKMKTTLGIVDQIQSQIEDLGLMAYEKSDNYIKNLLNTINNFLGTDEAKKLFYDIADGIKTVLSAITGVVKIIYNNWDVLKWLIAGKFVFGKVFAGLAGMVNLFVKLRGAFGAAAVAGGGFAKVLASFGTVGLLTGIGAVITGFILLATKIVASRSEFDKMMESSQQSREFKPIRDLQAELDATRVNALNAGNAIKSLLNPESELYANAHKQSSGEIVNNWFSTALAGVVGLFGGEEAKNKFIRADKTSLYNRGGYRDINEEHAKKQAFIAQQSALKEVISPIFSAIATSDFATANSKISDFDNEISNLRSRLSDAKLYAPNNTNLVSLDAARFTSNFQESKEFLTATLKDYVDLQNIVDNYRSAMNSPSNSLDFLYKMQTIGSSSMSEFLVPGTSTIDKAKVQEVYAKAATRGMDQKSIFAIFDSISKDLVPSLKTQVNTLPTDNVVPMTAQGDEDMDEWAKKTTAESGAGKMRSGSSGGKSIIVHIGNLMNIETANMMKDLPDLKDSLSAALVDVVKDFEIGY